MDKNQVSNDFVKSLELGVDTIVGEEMEQKVSVAFSMNWHCESLSIKNSKFCS